MNFHCRPDDLLRERVIVRKIQSCKSCLVRSDVEIANVQRIILDVLPTRLDDIASPLQVEAEALVAETGGFIYRFSVSAEGRALLSGQAAVILPP